MKKRWNWKRIPDAQRDGPRRQQQRAPQLEGRDVPLLHAVADILVDEIGQVQARCGPAGPQAAEGHPLPAYPPGRTVVRRRGLSDVAPDIAGLKGLFAGHCFTSCLRICIRRR